MSSAIQAVGTREGALRGWDTRGRGRTEQPRKEHDLSQLLAKTKAVFGENNLWSKLADKGHIGKVEPFTKEEQKELKEVSRAAGECKIGYCFMNAQRIAVNNIDNPKVQYVEGLVTVHSVPIDHAWIEYDGKVFDPTLIDKQGKAKDPTGSGTAKIGEYFGVTVPKDMIEKYQVMKGTYSPLSHARDDEIQKAVWGDRATIRSAADNENRIRQQMEHWVAYAESGPSFDPEGKYLCGTCTERIAPDKCHCMSGTISFTAGSCRAYDHGPQRFTEPAKHQMSQAEAQYGERPETKAFGCSRCEYGREAEKPDADGRKSYCDFFLVHIRKLACCAQEEGPDSVTPKEVKAAEDSDSKGTLWNGIEITGFSTPEEEAVRAMLSRVPPELLGNVKKIECAPELGAKHGRFERETQTIEFNPQNLQLRQRFGRGPGWLLHPELTVVHEVGHSVYDALSPEKKQEWNDLSGWMKGWAEGQLPPYEEKRPGWGNEISSWTHRPGIRFTRHYAERNPNEDFSDSFAFFLLNKGHQMAKTKRKFLEQLIQDGVRKYPQAAIQSPTKAYVMTAGGPGSGRHPTGRKPKELSDRAKRALESYNPATRAKQTVADANVSALAKLIGGQLTPNNKPFDILVGKTGIEVKTVFPDVKNDKITMHPESLARKNESAKELKLKSTLTVVVDERKNKGLYVKEGLGSFRLGSMEKVTVSGLKEMLT